MPTMHPSVANHPEWQALQARAAELERARRTAIAAGTEWEAECARIKAEHAEAMDRAFGTTTAPPPAPAYPPRPDTGTWLERVMAEKQALKAEQRSFLADHADDFLAVLHRAEDRVMREVAPIVATLEAPVRELAEIAATAYDIRRARGERVVASERVDAPAVVVAAANGQRWVPRPEPATGRNPAEVIDMPLRTSGDQVDAETAARRERPRALPRPWGRR